MRILQLLPVEQEVELNELLSSLKFSKAKLTPFDSRVIEFCHDLSQALFHDSEAKQFPELQALAFRMRRSELKRLAEQFSNDQSNNVLSMARGLVFHIPPANVQTVFVYSWLMSILAGNRNVIRLSRRDSPQAGILLRLFRNGLAHAPASIQESSMIVQYGHESEITAELSRLCDLRVIWGGDATVQAVRSSPLEPHARDLTFPDRFSLCAMRADAVLALDRSSLNNIASRFYNDTFWFDQMACSSPRLLLWCGSTESCTEASRHFLDALEQHVTTKGYNSGTAAKINKLTFGCRAVLDGQATGFVERGEIAVLTGENLQKISREHCGSGLLYEFAAQNLMALDGAVTRRDQTLTHFGFAREELIALARALNGSGVDRMVPVGQALQFQRNWDGYDLLREMTREVYISA